MEFGDGRDKKKKRDNGDVPLELREATYTPTRLWRWAGSKGVSLEIDPALGSNL